MAHPLNFRTDEGRERALLFGPVLHDSPCKDETLLDELASLVDSAGGEVVGRMVQTIRGVNPATYFGSGKIAELRALAERCQADLLVFDRELSPAQVRNIEEAAGVRVIDRSELIMDIFARRARSRQAQFQVALAQLQYSLPRLKRMWSHLDRMHAAIGARGPGETQIESDRRIIREKIQEYSRKLEEMTRERHMKIETRLDFKVSLVGYTNSGKSTLMNALTGADVYIADQLFATLDTTTRKLKIGSIGRPVLVSDTVGFVNHLPHHLVNSFHATLSEAMEADLLLHVVDASHQAVMAQVETVEGVLQELGCQDLPVLVAANKTDLPGSQAGLVELRKRYKDVIPVSALTGEGLGRLVDTIAADMTSTWTQLKVSIPFDQGKLIAAIRRHAEILSEKVSEKGMVFELRANSLAAQQLGLQNYAIGGKESG